MLKNHTDVSLSPGQTTFNGHNFYFTTEGIKKGTILNVKDSTFTHGRYSIGSYESGIKFLLLHTRFIVVVRLTNIYVTGNNENNVYIEYNVCKTLLQINNLNSSHTQTGLIIFTDATLTSCDSLRKWASLELNNVSFVNASIVLSNKERSALRNGVKYVISLSGVSVYGGTDSFPCEFNNVHNVFLRNVTFENTGGVFITNVPLEK